MKPVSYDDFLKAANKALEWFDFATRQQKAASDRFMYVKCDYKLQRVKMDDILYIEGLKDYVKIFQEKSAKPILSLMSMKSMEAMLP